MNEKLLSDTVLHISTGAEDSYIGLFIDGNLTDEIVWRGVGDLSETLIKNIHHLLEASRIRKSELSKITVDVGPGSYTGLRIGISVANSLAFSLGIPIFAAKAKNGILKIAGSSSRSVLPEYIKDPHITKSKRK